MKLVECIPNFSEGQQEEIILQIVAAINSVDGVYILHYDMDKDHNRTVITFLGHPDYIVEAAFRGISKATELLNLRNHTGEHPCLGIADVCPFVPFKNVTMEECVELAHNLAEKVHRELEIAVYLYENAALKLEHQNLANIRLLQKKLIPDLGTEHPTAGYICICARFFLIAYNVNLDTKDIVLGKKIAKKIREKNGGLKGIKALAFYVKEQVQVSMNIVDYRETSLRDVFQRVYLESKLLDIKIADSEIVGLVPEEAFGKNMREELKLTNFSDNQILEKNLYAQQTFHLNTFLDKLSSVKPTPGGGSCAALTAATAAALAAMITGISMNKKKNKLYKKDLVKKQKALQSLQYHLSKLIEEDSQAYQNYLDVRKMPRETKKEKERHSNAMDSALLKCVLIPLDISMNSLKILELLPLSQIIKSTISDAGIVCLQAVAAIKASHLTIRANLSMLKDPNFHKQILSEIKIINEKSQNYETLIMAKTNELLEETV